MRYRVHTDRFLPGWWKSVKPRRWTLVLIIGAWTMTIGFLIRIIWGIGDNADSIPVYAIQNLVGLNHLKSRIAFTEDPPPIPSVSPALPLRLPRLQLHGPPALGDLPRRRRLSFLAVQVDRQDLCYCRCCHLPDPGLRRRNGCDWWRYGQDG